MKKNEKTKKIDLKIKKIETTVMPKASKAQHNC